MVKNAFSSIIDCPTKLITFSDDMDGLRKVPENVPNKEMLEKFIGKPLTSIPDPFGKFESFGHHNNAKLRSFLDEFKDWTAFSIGDESRDKPKINHQNHCWLLMLLLVRVQKFGIMQIFMVAKLEINAQSVHILKYRMM